jgi:hypothetical protein
VERVCGRHVARRQGAGLEPDLIDSYVTALRGRLGWRGDVDDIVDEIADHLHEHVERLVARGEPHAEPHAEAQRHAVPGSSGSVQPVPGW